MNLYNKSFIYGFLYVFGLVSIPIPKDFQKIICRDDEKAIANDWSQIGKDVMKAYKATEKPTV
jgi:hypothetical protein